MPSAAPATLVARYGSDNGFGWQANETVGAQVVSVPFARTQAGSARLFEAFMTLVVAGLIAVWAAANGVLYWQVIRPVRRIARIADRLSLGQDCAEQFVSGGAAEITGLGRSFERMRKSLAKSLSLLGS